MEKSDPAYDTGIYRTPPRQIIDFADHKAVRAIWDKEEKEIFDLDFQLEKARVSAQEVLDQFLVPKPGQPHNVRQQVECAEEVFRWLSLLSHALSDKDFRKAALYGYWLGVRYEELRVRRGKGEKMALRGRKNTAAMREGHIKIHGTTAQKQERWAKYQKDLNTLAKRSPYRSFSALRRDVAKMNQVSFKTIERHTIDPRTRRE